MRLLRRNESYKISTNEQSLFQKSSNNPQTDCQYTLRAETFAGRNFRVFRVFRIFSRKFLPGKKLNKKFAKVNFAKNGIVLKIIATKIEHSHKIAKVSSVNFLQKVKIAKLKSAKVRDFSVSRKFLPLK